MSFGRMPADLGAVTDDAALGGRLRLLQPKRGHRFGHEAILLAAAVDARSGQRVVEFGAGVGAASLALLARVSGLDAVLAEIEPSLCALAAKNIERNGFGGKARAVALDVTKPRALTAARLKAGAFHHVLMNPPFNEPSRPSPHAMRRRAHAGSERLLHEWVATAQRLLRPSGTLTLIWRADGLPAALRALDGFGGIAILPVDPSPDKPAIRVILRAAKGSRAPLALLPPFVLNGEDKRPSAEAEAVLRNGAALRLG